MPEHSNELLSFMREIAARSDHVILGTATPIQTRAEDLWDLIGILHQGSGNFVLGNDFSKWHRPKGDNLSCRVSSALQNLVSLGNYCALHFQLFLKVKLVL